MRALWLPQVLRAAGLTVHEVPGWKTRGADSWGPVRGITCHHTGGSRTSTDAGEIRVLIEGRPDLSPPIAQAYLSRTGHWHVVASGHCNHNKTGWSGPNEGYGNDSLLGIEAQHSGGSEPWTARQYDSYVRGVAALVRHRAPGWDVTASRVAGHKEHQPGNKSDPTFDMTMFRARVRQQIEEMSNVISNDDIARIATAVEAKVWDHLEIDPVTDRQDYRMGGAIRMLNQRRAEQTASLRTEILSARSALTAFAEAQVAMEGAILDMQRALHVDPASMPDPESHPLVRAVRYVAAHPLPPEGPAE